MGFVKNYARDKWDQTRDWIHDKLGRKDPLYRHPETAVRLYESGSEKMSPEIRAERYNDLKAQVAYYYAKRRRDVPEHWVQRISAIDKDYRRLETLDKAAAVLRQHGPITKATIARDLEASKDYRIQAGIDKADTRQHQIEFTPIKAHIAAKEQTKSAPTFTPIKDASAEPLRAHSFDEAKPLGKANRKEKVQEHVAEV